MIVLLIACSEELYSNNSNKVVQPVFSDPIYVSNWNDTGEIFEEEIVTIETVNCYPHDNRTIADALDNLSSGDVYICKGSYQEDLLIDNKSVNIYASATLTNIESSSITIIDSNVSINGLKFIGSSAQIGSVISAINSNLNLSDVIITDNISHRGNIYLNNSVANVFNSLMRDNIAENGSVFLLEDSTLHIFNSEISNNHSNDGAILFDESSSSDLTFKNIIWNSGSPLFNPIDANTDYDIYFTDNWGYRFDIFDPVKYFCSNSKRTYPDGWIYPGICSF